MATGETLPYLLWRVLRHVVGNLLDPLGRWCREAPFTFSAWTDRMQNDGIPPSTPMALPRWRLIGWQGRRVSHLAISAVFAEPRVFAITHRILCPLSARALLVTWCENVRERGVRNPIAVQNLPTAKCSSSYFLRGQLPERGRSNIQSRPSEVRRAALASWCAFDLPRTAVAIVSRRGGCRVAFSLVCAHDRYRWVAACCF